MSHCAIHRSFRNRVLIALLPFARAIFAIQDAIYRLLGLDRAEVSTTPPSVPIEQAAPYAPTTGLFASRHGGRLFYREWPVVGGQPRAAVIAFDGLGSYSKQFHPMGPALQPRGIVAIGLDLPGHGLSDGPRSDLAYLPLILDGVADAIAFFARSYPDTPIYLLGESLGATLAVRVAARPTRHPSLAGLILASPELEPTHLSAKGGAAAWVQILTQVPYFFFWSRARSVDIAGREKLVARGLAVYERSRVDPLRNNLVSVRTIVDAFELIVSTPFWAQRTGLPTLLLQAECDLVTEPAAASALLDCLKTGDKELVYFAGAAHGLFYDPDTPEVLQVMADWLTRHCSRWPRG
ncbi:MAG: alpha/beta fold hydrolase, partial [Chloroflexota bacterium]